MPSSTHNSQHGKLLEGVQSTEQLRSVLAKCKELSKVLQQTTTDSSDAVGALVEESDARSVVSRAKQPLSLRTSMSILEECTSNDSNVIPMKAIRAMHSVLLYHHQQQQEQRQEDDPSEDDNTDKQDDSLQLLDDALLFSSTSLVFSSSSSSTPSSSTDEELLSPAQLKFRKRMERLRLRSEERRYQKLTQNLDTSVTDDDHITAKSMTYAASVGLNMIVAPISFGVFMYFFAGHLFFKNQQQEEESTIITNNNKIHANTITTTNTTDIRRVIVGVVSGVAMLFIEMILFVIRTHELDASVTRKKKKNTRSGRGGPFGYARPISNMESSSNKNNNIKTETKTN